MSGAGDLTLASLAQRELWVAWQTELREKDQKPTKVPYAPSLQRRRAEADEPSTWGKRPDAQRCADVLPKPFGIGGIGLEFASLGDGRSLAGTDFDTCRDPETGRLEGWAEDKLALFDTYSEVSPSQTGAKSFFTYDTDALPTLRQAMGGALWGKQYKHGGGDHPPGIELYLGRRFFAVTDEILNGSREELRHVPLATLLQLIKVDGPAFAKGWQVHETSKESTRTSADRSRSADAFRVGKTAVRNGASFDEMCAVLSADASTANWMREKGQANNYREARRIFDKSQEARTIIRVVAGELHTNASAGEAAIVAAGVPVYQRGSDIVRPVTAEVPASHGRMTTTAALHSIGCHGMVDVLSQCAAWERYDERSKDWLRTNPPKQVAEIILSRNGLWMLPKVVGVITCPTLRPDGSILSSPGYDASTRLYHAASPSLVLSPAVANPTRRNAEAALAALKALLSEFPFVDVGPVKGVSESVALSALITPVVRGALTVTPLHAIRANTPGSGKSHLVDTASTIATGRQCPAASAPAGDEAEQEKRITGMLLAGFPLASLDNVNGLLGGDLLCQAVERPLIRLRPLGSSGIVEIEARTTFFATGNGLRVHGDMTRRTLLCDLDANLERPDLKKFRGDPVATVMTDRGRYVSACLIVVRAYVAAKCPNLLDPLGSFGEWSNLVRSALVWLGCADPVLSMEAARADDPELEQLRDVIGAWDSCIPTAQAVTSKEMVDLANEQAPTVMGEPTGHRFPALHEALMQVAGAGRGVISTKRLSNWLRSHNGRIVDGSRFLRDPKDAHGGIARWALKKPQS